LLAVVVVAVAVVAGVAGRAELAVEAARHALRPRPAVRLH
jgi:hypothetical protein